MMMIGQRHRGSSPSIPETRHAGAQDRAYVTLVSCRTGDTGDPLEGEPRRRGVGFER
jgi:hypothetical protein